jgi:hypothetical protein
MESLKLEHKKTLSGFFCTVCCNTTVCYKPTTCTFVKLIVAFIWFDFLSGAFILGPKWWYSLIMICWIWNKVLKTCQKARGTAEWNREVTRHQQKMVVSQTTTLQAYANLSLNTNKQEKDCISNQYLNTNHMRRIYVLLKNAIFSFHVNVGNTKLRSSSSYI